MFANILISKLNNTPTETELNPVQVVAKGLREGLGAFNHDADFAGTQRNLALGTGIRANAGRSVLLRLAKDYGPFRP